MIPNNQSRLSIRSLKINQWCRYYQQGQVAENILLANEIGHWKREGGSYLYIHLYFKRQFMFLIFYKFVNKQGFCSNEIMF